MDERAAILAGVAPVLAILVEKFKPISEDSLFSQARKIIQDDQLKHQDPEVIAKTARGAVAVSSLAPTILSVVSGGLAIASEVAATGFLLLAVFIVSLAFLLLNLMKPMSGLSYYQIGAAARPLTWPQRFLKRMFRLEIYGPLHTVAISRFIYRTNALVLVMCFLVWVLTDDKSPLAGLIRAHLEGSINKMGL